MYVSDVFLTWKQIIHHVVYVSGVFLTWKQIIHYVVYVSGVFLTWKQIMHHVVYVSVCVTDLETNTLSCCLFAMVLKVITIVYRSHVSCVFKEINCVHVRLCLYPVYQR